MSWLKKEEIVQLVARVWETDDCLACLTEAKTLGSRGRGIVDTVLEEIFRFKTSGALAKRDSFPLYCLVISIEPYVELRHEAQLGEILLWDEVAFIEDGSTRFHLLEMLREVGSTEVIPYLEQLSARVKNVPYQYDSELASPESMRKYDQEEIQRVISAIRARVQ